MEYLGTTDFISSIYTNDIVPSRTLTMEVYSKGDIVCWILASLLKPLGKYRALNFAFVHNMCRIVGAHTVILFGMTVDYTYISV